MFKQNEYIVCLEGDFTCTDGTPTVIAAKNYCVKIGISGPYLALVKNIKGTQSPLNNDTFTFDKSRKLTNWRYANQVEIDYYNKIDKPYDVTILIKEEVTKDDYIYLVSIINKLNKELCSKQENI